MTQTPVDLRGSIVADLARGRIEHRGSERVASLPASWLVGALADLDTAAAARLGQQLGDALLPDVTAVLGNTRADGASPERALHALSTAFALRGLGTLTAERWGGALVVHVQGGIADTGAWAEILAAAIARAVHGLTGIEVSGAPVASSGPSLGIFLGHPDACAFVRARSAAGESLGALASQLAPAGGKA